MVKTDAAAPRPVWWPDVARRTPFRAHQNSKFSDASACVRMQVVRAPSRLLARHLWSRPLSSAAADAVAPYRAMTGAAMAQREAWAKADELLHARMREHVPAALNHNGEESFDNHLVGVQSVSCKHGLRLSSSPIPVLAVIARLRDRAAAELRCSAVGVPLRRSATPPSSTRSTAPRASRDTSCRFRTGLRLRI